MSNQTDFIWGVASSSYQIEGGWQEGEKGESIWDHFCHKSETLEGGQNMQTIEGGHTGDIACDHYHRYQEDLSLMHQMGIKAYRFSISWPRIFPKGDTTLNPQGLAFYDSLIDTMLSLGITPYLTLYHWDLPQALEKKGGWLNRNTADAFAYYAKTICEHFNGRVNYYFTINEPQCISSLGYYLGVHAPGLKCSAYDTLKVLHHLALAHGKATLAMRSISTKIQIGFATTGNLCYPATPNPNDIALARQYSFLFNEDTWDFSHTWFCDGTLLGTYPDASSFIESPIDFIHDEDMDCIKQPIDYLGVNVYNGHEVSASVLGGYVPKYPGYPRTALRWPVSPGVMNYGLQFLSERYNLPLYITENGVACFDKVFLDGKVHDQDRIDFLERYLNEMKQSMERGTSIHGYFHWAFTDNFEWNSGYDPRFGLVYIDFKTLERIPKDSAYWYQSKIKHPL